MLAVTSFEVTNPVFNITNENSSFLSTIPVYWSSRGGSERIIKLRELLRLRAQNDFELHVAEVVKKGSQIKIGDKEYKLPDLDTHQNETIKELKNVEYNDLEDTVFRIELT